MNEKLLAQNFRKLSAICSDIAFIIEGNNMPSQPESFGSNISISGMIESEFRTEKVLIYEINADNVEDSENPVRCVIFHNKTDFAYKKGDVVTFGGAFEPNTYKGKTQNQFVVKKDFTNSTKKAESESAPNAQEDTEDEIPF